MKKNTDEHPITPRESKTQNPQSKLILQATNTPFVAYCYGNSNWSEPRGMKTAFYKERCKMMQQRKAVLRVKFVQGSAQRKSTRKGFWRT